MGKFIDLTGQTFGTLKVIERAPNQKGHTMWKCICQNCGREKLAYGVNLRRGTQSNCGYQNCGGTRIEDLTGQIFGELTIRKQEIIKGHTYFTCKCSCGKEITIRATNVLDGHTRSCGHLRSEGKPIEPGAIFGEITVLEQLEKSDKFQCKQYKCLCSCGKEFITTGVNLRKGIQSCGHVKSKGETRILYFLQNKNIKFVSQWKNENFILQSGYPCVFDFAFFTKEDEEMPVFLLEYNGQQHYITRNSGWDTEENLFRTQQRDAEKAKLCEEAGIPLEIIPYTDFNNLEEVLTKLLQKYSLYEN